MGNQSTKTRVRHTLASDTGMIPVWPPRQFSVLDFIGVSRTGEVARIATDLNAVKLERALEAEVEEKPENFDERIRDSNALLSIDADAHVSLSFLDAVAAGQAPKISAAIKEKKKVGIQFGKPPQIEYITAKAVDGRSIVETLVRALDGKEFGPQYGVKNSEEVFVVTKVMRAHDIVVTGVSGLEVSGAAEVPSVAGAGFSVKKLMVETGRYSADKGFVIACEAVKFTVKDGKLTGGHAKTQLLRFRGASGNDEKATLLAEMAPLLQACWLSPTRKKLALCIGNDAYIHFPELRGAKTDAEAVGKYLESQGFKAVTLFDRTFEQMVKDLNDLLSATEEDDLVVLFYAGHGSWRNDGLGRSETLVPIDSSHAGRNCEISDRMLRKWLELMNQKTSQVMLIFDSCCSGGMYRGGGADKSAKFTSKRFVDGDERDVEKQGRPEFEDGKDLPSWLKGAAVSQQPGVKSVPCIEPREGEGFVMMAACRENEEAVEGQRGVVRQGLFTRALLNILQSCGDISVQALMDKMEFELRDCGQHPVFAGDLDRLVFSLSGLRRPAKFPFITARKVNDSTAESARTGAASGITLGSKYAVYLESFDVEPVGAVQVSTVGPFSAKFVVTGDKQFVLPEGVLNLVETHHVDEGLVTVFICPEAKETLAQMLSNPSKYKDEVVKFPMPLDPLVRVCEIEGEADYGVYTSSDKKAWEIRDLREEEVLAAPHQEKKVRVSPVIAPRVFVIADDKEDRKSLGEVCAQLLTIGQAKQVLRISNASTLLNPKVTVKVHDANDTRKFVEARDLGKPVGMSALKSIKSRVVEPVDQHTFGMHYYDYSLEKKEFLNEEVEENFSFEVTNTSGRDLHLLVVNVGYDFQVSELDACVVRSGETFSSLQHQPDLTCAWPKEFQEIPASNDPRFLQMERFQVILSTRKIDLSRYYQDGLCTPDYLRIATGSRAAALDDWCVISLKFVRTNALEERVYHYVTGEEEAKSGQVAAIDDKQARFFFVGAPPESDQDTGRGSGLVSEWPKDRAPPIANKHSYFSVRKWFMFQQRDVFEVVLWNLVGKYYTYETVVHTLDEASAKDAVETLNRTRGKGLQESDLLPGDHIWVYRNMLFGRFGWYQHHGIWEGENTIEFNEVPGVAILRLLRWNPPGEVQRGSFKLFSGNGANLVFRYPHGYKDRKAILQRADQLLGMGFWEPTKGNCEHMAFYCATGKACSLQTLHNDDAEKKIQDYVKGVRFRFLREEVQIGRDILSMDEIIRFLMTDVCMQKPRAWQEASHNDFSEMMTLFSHACSTDSGFEFVERALLLLYRNLVLDRCCFDESIPVGVAWLYFGQVNQFLKYLLNRNAVWYRWAKDSSLPDISRANLLFLASDGQYVRPGFELCLFQSVFVWRKNGEGDGLLNVSREVLNVSREASDERFVKSFSSNLNRSGNGNDEEVGSTRLAVQGNSNLASLSHGTVFALSIGVGLYDHESTLPGAPIDAADFQILFSSWAFDKELFAGRVVAGDVLNFLKGMTTRFTTVIFTFSGHGEVVSSRFCPNLKLVFSDGSRVDLYTLIPELERIADRFFLVLDCCFSAAPLQAGMLSYPLTHAGPGNQVVTPVLEIIPASLRTTRETRAGGDFSQKLLDNLIDVQFPAIVFAASAAYAALGCHSSFYYVNPPYAPSFPLPSRLCCGRIAPNTNSPPPPNAHDSKLGVAWVQGSFWTGSPTVWRRDPV